MRLSSRTRDLIAYTLAGVAIVLRLASDWIFPGGGPFLYQLLQAFLLLVALLFLWQHLETVFLRGGQTRLAIKIGLLGIPLGLMFGFGSARLEYVRPLWPSPAQLGFMVANNIFFSAVEELEFRGFLLSWLGKRKLSPVLIVLLVTTLAALAHAHRFWQGDIRSIAFTIAANAWWTWLVYRTRSIWGAWIAHSTWNIFVLLPVLGSATNIR